MALLCQALCCGLQVPCFLSLCEVGIIIIPISQTCEVKQLAETPGQQQQHLRSKLSLQIAALLLSNQVPIART